MNALPGTWRGDQLLHRPDFLYQLTRRDCDELDAALALVNSREVPLTAITRALFPLPHLGARLVQMQQDLEQGSGTVRLRGLPVARYSLDDLERLFWGLAAYIGAPLPQSADGRRLFHVSDAGFGADDPNMRGPNSNKRLRFHTDRCDVIAFLCVRAAASGGDNLLVDARWLYREIKTTRPDLAAVLEQPFYYLRHTVDTANPKPYITQPIFALHNGVFTANVLRVLIERAHHSGLTPPLTPLQTEALDYLDALAEDAANHVRFRQESGDLLFVNNFVVFHRRDGFTDHGDPEQRRLLLRLWLTVPNSRPLPESFRGMYRALGAGERRGGMPTAQDHAP